MEFHVSSCEFSGSCDLPLNITILCKWERTVMFTTCLHGYVIVLKSTLRPQRLLEHDNFQ